MNVQIQDRHILRQVPPEALKLALRSAAAVPFIQTDDLEYWRTKDNQQLVVPLRPEFDDYPNRVFDVVDYLARFANRSQLEVLKDLQAVAFDVLRVPYIDGSDEQYNIPFEVGVRLVSGLHDLMISSAYAAVHKRAVVPPRRPKTVVDYVESLKLGQYLNGRPSYAVLSPIAGAAAATQADLFGVESYTSKPFGRQVLETMQGALRAAVTAAQRARETGTIEVFDEVVDEGVNSTLCDAVADLVCTNPERNVDLLIHWSPRLPSADQRAETHVVTERPQDADIFKSAARRLRAIAEREDQYIIGQVVSLRYEGTAPYGRVGVLTNIDGKPRLVSFELPQNEYLRAVDAHRDRKIVSVIGTLRREGTTYLLGIPQGFRVLDEPLDVALFDDN